MTGHQQYLGGLPLGRHKAVGWIGAIARFVAGETAMPVCRFVLGILCATALFGAAAFVGTGAGAQSNTQSNTPSNDGDLNALGRKVQELQQTGKHAEALLLGERYVALARERHGEDRVEFATAISWLGSVYQAQGRYTEAEPLFRRASTILENALGPNHLEVARSLNNLGWLHQQQGRYSDAEPLHKRSLLIRETVLGPNHAVVAPVLNNLALVHKALGRYADAEPLLKRTIAILEANNPNDTNLGLTLDNLAQVYVAQGRYAEAEPLHKRAVALQERVLGASHPTVATAIHNLALLYQAQGRYADAESLFKRAIDIYESALGPGHPSVGTALGSLAEVYHRQGKYADAEPLLRRSLAIREKTLGPNHASVGIALNNLALLLAAQADNAEAEPLYKRAIAVAETALGPSHPEVATAAFGLAALYRGQGRHGEAVPQYRRALAIRESVLGPDHPRVGTLVNNLGGLHVARGEWRDAVALLERGTAIFTRRSRWDRLDIGRPLTGQAESEAVQSRLDLTLLIRASHRLAQQERTQAEDLARRTFLTAQWAHGSGAAASLSLMAAREAKGDPQLSRLIRERQDLASEWLSLDKLQIAAVSLAPDKRNATTEQERRTRLGAIDARLADVDKALASDFPDYAALANPEPLSVADTQAQLGDDEALLLVLDSPHWGPVPEETFIWAVTKTDARWIRSELGTKALTERVAALRCGLDRTAWDGDGEARCSSLLHGLYTAEDVKAGKMLPFDLARAHELHRDLFGQAEDLIKGKHLLIVPSGPLASLPFQVLVTEKPAAAIPVGEAGYANTAWLARRHAVTVLPSVASLRALRQVAKASKATQPFVGFGNPLLLGPDGRDRRAWEREGCRAASAPMQVASRSPIAAFAKFFRRGLADVAQVRAQYPLPETTDELCAVAHSIGAGDGAVYLGAKASETTIKALSANGQLAQAKIVHFATHGLLAGETEMLADAKAEPALILTPPDTASEDDDGLLTASEIAQLKLDADWVVLSACNTAAGESDKPGAEALSGLARAFFYAGARALLVSHWAVNSDATVMLITKAFDEIKTDARIGRAEGLRRSMLSLVEMGDGYAHPSIWAPFVVVGEGAR